MSKTRPAPPSPRNRSNSDNGFQIQVRGAREHNLKSIDVDIPQGQLVVLTGPSGSGKTSLAINTVFAEGQRQYIETLSTYARRFVDDLPRPDVDSIEGLQPTLCLDQHPSHSSPRSTVGTVTEIHDYLRILMARAAEIHCHQCGSPIRQLSEERIVQWIEALPAGTKVMILAPMVRGRRGQHIETVEQIRQAGLVRARVDGQMVEIDVLGQLNPRQKHTIEAVTDRIVVRPGIGQRVAESVDLALRLADGTCLVHYLDAANDSATDTWRESVFSIRFACPNCDVAYAELEPKNFSFNSPCGACPECQGLGWIDQFDPELVIGDAGRSLNAGAIAPWQMLTAAARRRRLAPVADFLTSRNLDAETPLARWSPQQTDELLGGDGADWPGLLNLLEQEFATTLSEKRQETLASFRGLVACRACQASRLGPQARSASIAGRTIIDINRASLADSLDFFQSLKFDESRMDIGGPLATEIARRLRFLCHVGLDYLTLDRPADSLSGGEYQRVRLATSIGSGLANVCYVLDEPTIGLHPDDNERLIDSILKLKDDGNTIIVVEHDADMMRRADWIIDVGPAAGQQGGEIIFQGTPAQLVEDPASVTGAYLSGRRHIARPAGVRTPNPDHAVILRGAAAHNLQNIDVPFPLGLLIAVTGVSGSGKSTLVQDTLAPAIARHLGLLAPRPGAFRELAVYGPLESLVQIDQRPIGRSARSNTATYSGLMDDLRKLFASTREARARGFTAARFSFNSSAGRCPVCQGYGQQRIEMNFLPDIHTTCPECRGRRYNHQTLEIRYRGHTIADVLDMPIQEARQFFQNVASVHSTVSALADVGLGYLPLGQPSTTLSGGEAQRVKLATELGRKRATNTLYLLDEPTTGLHFEDVQRLLAVLHRLVDQGNSVLVIEHHPDLIATADWEIRMGPGGGDHGGRLVHAGPPAAARH